MRRTFVFILICLVCAVPCLAESGEESAIPGAVLEPGGWGEDAYLGAEAALALGRIGAAAVPGLAKLLDSRDPRLRSLAALGLAGAGPAAKPYLKRVIAELMSGPADDSYYDTVYSAGSALASAGPEAITLLAAELDQGGAHASRGLSALAGAGPAAAPAVDAIAKLLAADDPALRASAVDTLAVIGAGAAPAADALVAALKDPDADVRRQAAYALGELKLKPAAAVPALLAAMAQDPENETWIGGSLTEYGRDALAALPRLSQLLLAPATCQDAELALVKLGPAALPAFTAALASPDADVRYYAETGVAQLGPAAIPAVPVLLKALSDPDTKVRWNAAQCLGNIGAEPATVVPALTALLKDADSQVRYCAAFALGLYGAQAAAAVPALAELLKDPVVDVRWGAAGALLAMGRTAAPAEDALLAAFSASQGMADGGARLAAALLVCGSGQPATLTKVSNAMRDEVMAAGIADELVGCGPAGIALLAQMLGWHQPNARLSAAAALAEAQVDVSAALPALKQALKRERGLSAMVMAHAVFTAKGGADAVLPVLAAGLKDKDTHARWYAAYTLEAVGQASPAIVEGLRHVLRTGSWDHRLAVAYAIQAIGPPAADAVPELLACLKREAAGDS